VDECKPLPTMLSTRSLYTGTREYRCLRHSACRKGLADVVRAPVIGCVLMTWHQLFACPRSQEAV